MRDAIASKVSQTAAELTRVRDGLVRGPLRR